MRETKTSSTAPHIQTRLHALHAVQKYMQQHRTQTMIESAHIGEYVLQGVQPASMCLVQLTLYIWASWKAKHNVSTRWTEIVAQMLDLSSREAS